MLTPDQSHILLELIQKQTLAFAGATLGPHILSQQDKDLLASHGVDYNRLYDESKDLVSLNFHLGMLSNILGQERVKGLTYDQLHKYVQSGQHIPLNARERATINNIKMQSMSDIRSHNGKIFQDINNVVVNEHLTARANQEEFIREQIIQGTVSRKSRKSIAREIARLTGDWSRNFDKSVQYISHTALNEGRAALAQRRAGSSDNAKVYFQVQNGACTHCIEAYLTNGIGSEPIVFTLAELEGNGTNIGRKTKEWQPTISALHINCRCLLTEYIEGTIWNGSKFVFPKGKKPQSDGPVIRVVFNGKEYFV